MIDYSNLYKIRVANPDDSFLKHEIIKLILMCKILNKHKNERSYIRVYTEFCIKDGKKCDLYYENLKTKEAYIYEVQKEISEKWTKEVTNFYKDFNINYLRTTDLIIIPVKELSDDITKLSLELNKYVY